MAHMTGPAWCFIYGYMTSAKPDGASACAMDTEGPPWSIHSTMWLRGLVSPSQPWNYTSDSLVFEWMNECLTTHRVFDADTKLVWVMGRR